MHRSGTSFLASLLRGMGVHMGDTFLEADRGNPRGYHEDKDVLAFHDGVLRARLPDSQGRGAFLVPPGFRVRLTDAERAAAADLVARHRREGPWGWKEPRTCLFLDHWLEALPQARCVAVYRHPLEVFYSFLKRRDWSALLAPEAVFDACAAYNEAILRAREAAEDRFMILAAGTAFADVPALAGELARFLGLSEPELGALPGFAAGEFTSLGVTEEQHRLMTAAHPLAAVAYEAMQAVAEQPEEFSTDGTRTVLPPALISLVAATLEERAGELATAAIEAASAMDSTAAEDLPDASNPGATADAVHPEAGPLAADRAGLHSLVETLCLNVPPATLHQLKSAIVAEIETAHERLRGERDKYIGLYERYFPLYENYKNAWEGCENTLHGTRRWIHEDLMPIVRQIDLSEGRRNQAADVGRKVLDRDGGVLSLDNAAARHARLPRSASDFYTALYFGSRGAYLGATSPHEQIYTEWLASAVDLSTGSIVDLGSWLGSFAKSLANGVMRNPTTQDRVAAGEKLIHAADIFRWHVGFDVWVRDTPHAGKYQDGEDFEDAFAYEIRDHAHLIETHKVDLTQWEWHGGHIPLLVNDAWKTLAIAAHCVRTFLPALRPGSILLNQDQLWCTESFIHVAMYRLRDYFEPLLHVPNATSVSFLCTRAIETVPDMPVTYEDIALDEIDAAFDWINGFFQRTGDELASQVLPLGKAWLLAQKGETARAREVASPVVHTKDKEHGFIRWELDGFASAGFGHLLSNG